MYCDLQPDFGAHRAQPDREPPDPFAHASGFLVKADARACLMPRKASIPTSIPADPSDVQGHLQVIAFWRELSNAQSQGDQQPFAPGYAASSRITPLTKMQRADRAWQRLARVEGLQERIMLRIHRTQTAIGGPDREPNRFRSVQTTHTDCGQWRDKAAFSQTLAIIDIVTAPATRPVSRALRQQTHPVFDELCHR